MFPRTDHPAGTVAPRMKSRTEDGDTLVEVLLAIVILGITSVAILLAFATSISGSAEHRSLATMDTVLRTAAEEAISQIQQQTNTQFGTCPVPDVVNFVLPTGYTATIAPTGYPTMYWNGTGFGSEQTSCVPSTSSSPQVNSPQLITITVTSPTNVTSSPLSFVVDDPQSRPLPVAGAATKLVFLTSPNGAPPTYNSTAGTAFPTQPIVAVEDAKGNPVTSDFSAVTLSISSGTAGASMSNNCLGTEFEGVVTFTGCSINQAGTYTLTATDTEVNSVTNLPLTPALSSSFVVSPAPATQLVFNPTTPGPGTAGIAIPSVAVQVEDSLGNVVTTATGSVTVTIKTGSPQSGFTSGTSTVNVTNGVATFSNLVVNTSGTYTLTASPISISGVTGTISSNSFTVAPGAASTFTVANPGSQTVGVGFGVSITAYDAYGNVATGFTGSQSITFSGPSNSPNASTPSYPGSVSFSFGLGTATGITLVDVQTTTLTATQGTVAGTTGSFIVSSSTVTKFTLGAPGTQVAGVTFNESITATDAYGNVLSAYSGAKAIAFSGPVSSPNATAPTYPSTVNFVSGVGTASIKLVDAQTTTLTAALGVITGVSANFTVSPGSASKLVFIPATPGPGTAGSPIPNLSVQVQDSLGNVATNAVGSISMSIKSGSPQSTFTSGTTSVVLSGGTATFSNLVVAASGSYTLTATPVGTIGTTIAVSSTAFTVNVLPNITTISLPGATKTGTYSQTLAVSGGTPSYTWSISSGALPAGLTLGTSSGIITGAVGTTATTQSFTVKVTDANAGIDTQPLTITVNAIPNITTTTLPSATKTGTYSQTLVVSGGTTPNTWSISSGVLPAGLTLGTSSGIITGAVGTTATTQNFTVAVTDADGVVDTQALTITVNAVPNITTTTLPGATRTGAYSQTLAITGGTPLYTWSLSSGTLPTGLTLGASTGQISGTISSTATSQNFTVEVTDANNVIDTQPLTITVSAAPSITTSTLPAATKTGTYSQTIGISGGTAPFTWSISIPSLPGGLSLNTSTGVISGTATTTVSNQAFTVKVTDADGVTSSQSLTLTVNAAPSITTSTLPAATKRGTYSQTLSASGGTAPFTWSLVSGTLPAGLSINASSGVISGTVRNSASSQNSFTVQVTDANGVTDTQSLTITVN